MTETQLLEALTSW